MSASDWLRNTRGEWFVIAQTALMLAVLVAPKLEGRNVFWSGITGAAGGLLCIVGLGFVVLGSIALGRNLSPFPKPKEKGTLVESGIFSVVRHPIYSGFSLPPSAGVCFGTALLLSSPRCCCWRFSTSRHDAKSVGSKKSSLATQHINRVSRNSFHSFIEAKLGIEHWAGGRLHIDQAVSGSECDKA